MFRITNLKGLIDELKCNQCNKILSALPVYYCAAVGNVCGRCTKSLDWMIANGTLEKALAYEAVARYLIFPCINNGCNAKLKWNEVEEHEKTCTVRDYLCPFNNNLGCGIQCQWKGNMVDVVNHLHVEHKEALQVNQLNFIMNTHEDNAQLFLTVAAEQTFIVLTKYVKETNKFYCIVLCGNKEPESQFYRFQLEIGRSNDFFLILRKNNTEPLANINEIACNYDKMISVDVTSVMAMLNNQGGLIYCRVGITKKSKKDIATISEQLNPTLAKSMENLSLSTKNLNENASQSAANSKIVKVTAQNGTNPQIIKISAKPTCSSQLVKNLPEAANNIPQSSNNPPEAAKCSESTNNPQPAKSSSSKRRKKNKNNVVVENAAAVNPQADKQLSMRDKQFLEELECPVCSNHMIPPIYICPTGHSICNECKFKVLQCPSCRELIGTTRNYTLEKLTAKVPYPCKYTDLGCSEILDSVNIGIHEQNCIYARNKCPLKSLITCNSKNDLIDVIGHLREKHQEYIVEANQEYARNLNAKITSSYYAAVHENEIFIVCCKHSSTIGPVKFNVMHIGMQPNRPKYRFELQFLDQTNKGLKLIINQLCQPLQQSASVALKKCLALPLEMLEPFISNKQEPTLYFKFFIQRI